MSPIREAGGAAPATAPLSPEVAALVNATAPFAAYLKCCEPLKPTESVRVSAGQFSADCAALVAAVDALREGDASPAPARS